MILYGDSHAQSTAAAVQMENPQAALSWSRGGCPTLAHFAMHDKTVESQCRGFNREKLQQLKTEYSGIPVVLFSRAALYAGLGVGKNSYRISFPERQASFADAYTEEYVSTVCSIAENHPVYIVKPIPEMPFSVYKGLNLNQRLFRQTTDISLPLQTYEKRNRIAIATIEAAASRCNATVIDPDAVPVPQRQLHGVQGRRAVVLR